MREIASAGLETEFEQWMRSELRYMETERGIEVLSSDEQETYVMHIYGRGLSSVWKWLGIVGIVFLAIAGARLLEWGYLMAVLDWLSAKGIGLNKWVMVIGCLAIGGGLVGLKFLGAKFARETWVHCNQYQPITTVAEVSALAAQIKDVKSDKEQTWHPNRVLMVALESFDPQALELARKNKIHCYQPAEVGFERVR